MLDAGAALLGPLAAAAWIRLRKPQRIGLVAAQWTVALLLTKALPLASALAGRAPDRPGFPPWLVGIGGWIGAVLFLRALWFLSTTGRPRGRAFPYLVVGLALAVAVPAISSGSAPAFLFLAAPMLWSFRWRHNLGASGLAVAALLGMVTFFVGILHTGTIDPHAGALARGSDAFVDAATALAVAYALLATAAAATRIHLSVRRIGRRLTLSHLLAALIPFLLTVAFLLVAGGFFLATYRGSLAVKVLAQQSERAQEWLSNFDGTVSDAGPEPFGKVPERQYVVSRDAAGRVRVLRAAGAEELSFSVDSLLARDETSSEVPLVWDGRDLFLRARWEGERPEAGGLPVAERREALVAVDSLWMAGVSALLGVPVRIVPRLSVGRQSRGVTIGPDTEPDDDEEDFAEGRAEGQATRRESTRTIGPRDAGGFRLPGGATVDAFGVAGGKWRQRTIPVASSASFGENLSFFWSLPRENPIALVVMIALAFIAFLFLATIGIATRVVWTMAQSITSAVRALTGGTRALREGRLDHRIPVEGRDELWDVAASFNEMAADLEETRVRELAAQRMEEELRLARIIQDRLLPSRPPQIDRLELAGMSLPAREVGGDYYDYLLLDDGRLGIAVADVSGKGTPAALLMSAFRAALRSQDLGAVGPAEALARINRFIHESVDPGKFITAFLGLIDPQSGEIRYANAGHDAPLLVTRAGEVSELTGGGLILGMLPQIIYEEAVASLEPGTLLAVVTDGVTEAQNPQGEFFGTERLAQALQRDQARPCTEILRGLTEEIAAFAGTGPQSDDITVILARRPAPA